MICYVFLHIIRLFLYKTQNLTVRIVKYTKKGEIYSNDFDQML